MDNKLDLLFAKEDFLKLYKKTEELIKNNSMDKALKMGVLVGLSGGADSVMLLHLLLCYRKNNFDFKIICVHINHMIRGEEADRDEKFSEKLACDMGLEFISFKFDVPKIANESGLGLEECARNIRYSCFSDIISSREDVSYIATAHNADDNLETVLLNILRGSGTRGGAGIPLFRDNIIRPMLSLKKCDITSVLDSSMISYVTDSTNLSSDYSRNYVRHEILPRLMKICRDPQEMFRRFSSNLRLDDDYINSQAENLLKADKIYCKDILSLPRALQRRVLSGLTGINLSESLFSDILSLLNKKDFAYNIGNDLLIVCENGLLKTERVDKQPVEYCYPLSDKETDISEYSSIFIISKSEIPNFSLNIYSLSIQKDISSAIICGSLYLRPKKDGDTVYYGGMTHKVKKLFSDRKIPRSLRQKIPVLCDEKGVVWIPGFGVRDDGGKRIKDNSCFAALCIKNENTEARFYSASEFQT